MTTAALRPAFLSSLGDRTSSMSCETVRVVVTRSCSGSNLENSSIAALITAEGGGGGSSHGVSVSERPVRHSDRVSCSHAPRTGLRS